MPEHHDGTPVSSRLRVVLEVEDLLRGHLDVPITIGALSRSVGVSERTLRNAFADVHRESPKRYFLNERLRRAQQALSDVRCAETTVTAVATQYGFYELGRFALKYKALFGESPSHTLRRHRPSTRLQRAG
jgi:AraC family transcriptional regulator, ethanolamine operon transcriptional activator